MFLLMSAREMEDGCPYSLEGEVCAIFLEPKK